MLIFSCGVLMLTKHIDKCSFLVFITELLFALKVVRILSTSEGLDFSEMKHDDDNSNNCLANQYLNRAHSILCCNILDGMTDTYSNFKEETQHFFFNFAIMRAHAHTHTGLP